MNIYEAYVPLHNKEISFGQESILEEEYKLFSKEDKERICFMRERIVELWRQNPNFTLKDLAIKMRESGFDPKLIDAVLGKRYISSPIPTTKQKLIQSFLDQNPHFSEKSIKNHRNKIKKAESY